MANAAVAVAAAVSLGVPPTEAAAAVASVTDVDGRYRVVAYRDRAVRTLLAKNPAGWRETLAILPAGQTPTVLVMNAREADGRDLSWLWDVPFERLRGRPIVVSGERATDLAVRLSYAQVPHEIVRNPLTAIRHAPAGPVDVVGNYTAFRDLTRRLGHAR
jgi:UDP-N-acetylmuramyl tripeptide synthase